MLLLHSSGILFDRKILFNILVSHTIAISPRHIHILIGIPSGPIALPPFHPFQGFSDLRFLNPPHKTPVSVIKRVVQLNGGVLVLTMNFLLGFISIKVAKFLYWLTAPNTTLLLYQGLGPTMLGHQRCPTIGEVLQLGEQKLSENCLLQSNKKTSVLLIWQNIMKL